MQVTVFEDVLLTLKGLAFEYADDGTIRAGTRATVCTGGSSINLHSDSPADMRALALAALQLADRIEQRDEGANKQ